MNNNNIEFLYEICRLMQSYGLVRTKAEFSTLWLSKGPSYLTSMRAHKRIASDDLILLLAIRLKTATGTFASSTYLNSDAAPSIRRALRHYGDVVALVEARLQGVDPFVGGANSFPLRLGLRRRKLSVTW